MNIRKANKEDLDIITDLCVEMLSYHQEFDKHYKPSKDAKERYHQHLSRSLGDCDDILLVAEFENNIVGFGFAEIKKKPPVLEGQYYGYISDVYVKEEYRKKGISKQIIESLFSWFKDKNIINIEIGIHANNKIGTKVWSKYGFEPYMTQYRLRL